MSTLNSQGDAEVVARKVRVVGHFLQVMCDMAIGNPELGARVEVSSESLSVVMEDLASRCMAAEREIEALGSTKARDQ